MTIIELEFHIMYINKLLGIYTVGLLFPLFNAKMIIYFWFLCKSIYCIDFSIVIVLKH